MRYLALVPLIFVLAITACDTEDPQIRAAGFMDDVARRGEEAKGLATSSAVVVIGNHSYIPGRSLHNNESTGLDVFRIRVVDAFEKAHPELEVTSWDVMGYGIVLNHHPKTVVVAPRPTPRPVRRPVEPLPSDSGCGCRTR